MKETKSRKGEKSRINKSFIFFALIFFIYIIDRQTKMLSSFLEGCFILCIKKSVNYGAAFGLMREFSFTRILLIVIALVVLIFTAYLYFKNKNVNTLNIGLALLFAGTLSNLFDRIIYGYVTDFIKIGFWQGFPAFNIADLSNLIGVLIIITVLIKNKSS